MDSFVLDKLWEDVISGYNNFMISDLLSEGDSCVFPFLKSRHSGFFENVVLGLEHVSSSCSLIDLVALLLSLFL